jgi:hypothetical protein
MSTLLGSCTDHNNRVGLAYLAYGAGCWAGSVLAGRSMTADFKVEGSLWHHEQGIPSGAPSPCKPLPLSFPLERARLGRGLHYSITMILSLLLFGWSLTNPASTYALSPQAAHWLAPLLAQFAVGWSSSSVLTCNGTLCVDLFPEKSASAIAMQNFARCLFGAAGVAAVAPFLQRFHAGWLSVLIAGIVLIGLVPYE